MSKKKQLKKKTKPKVPKIISYTFECQGTWKWTCSVCWKKYYKLGSHANCYKRYCGICTIVTNSVEELIEHAKLWHKDNYCTICQMPFLYIKNHNNNYHSKS